MEKTIGITEYFEGVETIKEHNGYFCSVGEALTVVTLGSLCGLRNVSQISQWAANERVKSFLADRFRIDKDTVLLLAVVPARAHKTSVVKPMPDQMGAIAYA